VGLKTEDGRLVVVSGASRSGKTWFVTKKIERKKRVLVYDAEDQFSQLKGFVRVTSQKQLLKLVSSAGAKKIAFVPSGDVKKAFDFWAGCAFHWVRYYGAADIVAEELADVSSPAKAPPAWGVLIRRGLKRGANIYAISQRWAEADKTAVGNASDFVVFRSNGVDVEYIARRANIAVNDVVGLRPLQYIKKDCLTGKIAAVATMK
jgi:hypothetical protein